MGRLIDADVAMMKCKSVEKLFKTRHPRHYFNADGLIHFVEKLFEHMPTIDPVKHGEWLSCSDRPDRLICSVCNRGFDMWFYEPEILPHCPNCGARMNGDKE